MKRICDEIQKDRDLYRHNGLLDRFGFLMFCASFELADHRSIFYTEY